MTTTTFIRHIWLLSLTMSVITRQETDHLVRTEAGMGRDRAMHTAQGHLPPGRTGRLHLMLSLLRARNSDTRALTVHRGLGNKTRRLAILGCLSLNRRWPQL